MFIKRFYICNGDKTTAGGTVIASSNQDFIRKVPRAREGDKVSCPACKSTGVIKCVPPMRRNDVRGFQQAIEGDLCMCGCNPPPRLVAGVAKNFVSEDFNPKEITGSPLAMQWFTSTGRDVADLGLTHSIKFHVTNKKGGKSLANAPYKVTLSDGSTHEGKTDSSGMTEQIYASSNVKATIEVPYHGDNNSISSPNFYSDNCCS